jgi:hypothetical protein
MAVNGLMNCALMLNAMTSEKETKKVYLWEKNVEECEESLFCKLG